jgi:hypothetical protein
METAPGVFHLKARLVARDEDEGAYGRTGLAYMASTYHHERV